MKRGREFKSRLDHRPVPRFSDILENRSKSARVRAICDHAWTRRTPSAAESAESSKTYPGAIWLGPWIIAVNSPADRTRRTGPMKADGNLRAEDS